MNYCIFVHVLRCTIHLIILDGNGALDNNAPSNSAFNIF